jgi:putative transposase
MTHHKTVRHVHVPGHLHELTFSCYRCLPLLTNDLWRDRLARSLDEANREAGIELVGFVFMPEHIHLLVHLTDPAQSIGRYLARIKQPFSKQIKDILVQHRSSLLRRLTVRERPGKTCFRFWQEGSGYDRNLFSPGAIRASLAYLHENPVRRGLCRHSLDWRWSSAQFYLGDPPLQQQAPLPVVHGLPHGSPDLRRVGRALAKPVAPF